MDSWADQTWGFENTPIPSGKVVAYPFLANGGAGGGEGFMEFSNNMPDLTATGYYWKGWFSETPGGAVLNNNDSRVENILDPNPVTPNQDGASRAILTGSPATWDRPSRVLYFSMGVECLRGAMV